MKLIPSTWNRQRGFVSGKLMLILVVAAVFVMVKTNSSPSLSGESATTLAAEMGEPIKKEKIPRPR